MNRLLLRDNAKVVKAPTPMRLGHALDSMGGVFNIEVWRGDKFLRSYRAKNGITNEGKNDALDVLFDGGTQKATWFLGLIDLANFTALAADDIYDDIDQAGNGWDEFADYTDPANGDSAVTRPTWTPGEPASQSITNATVVEFDITSAGTVKGLFVAGGTNAQTKSDHTASGNVLWATALFTGGDVAVNNGETLKVTYTVSA
jgi:hypothetical protein